MNVNDIVQKAKSSNPDQLGKISDVRARRLLREAFAIMLDEIENLEEDSQSSLRGIPSRVGPQPHHRNDNPKRACQGIVVCVGSRLSRYSGV